MTGQLLEIARPRFLAAAQARLLVSVDAGVVRVQREGALFVKATGAPTAPAATTPPWSDVLGIVLVSGQVPGAPTQYRFLVGLDQLVGLEVVD